MIEGGIIIILLSLYWAVFGGEHQAPNELGPVGLFVVIVFYGAILFLAWRLVNRLTKHDEQKASKNINRYRRDWER